MISGAVGPGDHGGHTSSIWFVSILGGKPRRLRGGAYMAVLSPDDSLVAYRSQRGIWLADADGENPRRLSEAGSREWLGSPAWSSDGKRILYRRLHIAEDTGLVTTIESRDLEEETSTVLVGPHPVPLAELTAEFKHVLPWTRNFLMLGDRLVYAMSEPAPRTRDENLWEITIDPRSGRPQGEPRRLTNWVGFDIHSLSATADGSQLAFVNDRRQDDVYVGELGNEGKSLGNTRRLTLDDRNDLPSCWTPDGSAVVFQSDRYGSADLLVQSLDDRNARDLVVGAGDQRDALPTPDGTTFLYWETREGANRLDDPRRLIRIPVDGGPTEVVLEVETPAFFDCWATSERECLIFEARHEERTLVASVLDPVTGKGRELRRYDGAANLQRRRSDFAPAGAPRSVTVRTARLTLRENDKTRDIDVKGPPGMTMQEVQWSFDGSGLYIVAGTGRGNLLMHVDLEGEASVLHEEQTGYILAPRPSPDGRHLAFGKTIRDGNAWMVEDF